MILILIILIFLILAILIYSFQKKDCQLSRYIILVFITLLVLKLLILIVYYFKGNTICQISQKFYCPNLNPKINSNIIKKI